MQIVEQENKNTFYKNVEEIGQRESLNDLRYYFEIVGEKTIVWTKKVPQKIEEQVNFLASKYLV